MDHPAIAEDRVAVITGGASGIGLAVAQALVSKGMQVCIADRSESALEEAAKALGDRAMTAITDVSNPDSVESLRDAVLDRFGEVHFLMNNAGTGGRGATTLTGIDQWHQIMGVNLWGVVNGLQAFGEQMASQQTPGAIVNTGSKQGITNPPGNPAYNVSKAGIRSLTESLAHELRNREGCQVTAHLLVPGFTYTGMISAFLPERPPGAWLPEQVASTLLERMGNGDFYIICPDNDVTEEIDQARMQWNMDDVIENRPALSRWHPDFADAFEAFVANWKRSG